MKNKQTNHDTNAELITRSGTHTHTHIHTPNCAHTQIKTAMMN